MLSEECLKQLEWQNQLFLKKKIDEMFKDFRTSILKCQSINSADEEKAHQKDEEESTIATNEEHFEEGNTDVVEFTIYDPDFFKRTTEEVKKHSGGSEEDSLNQTGVAIARNQENFEEENTDVVDFTLYDQYENESSYDESKIVDEIRFKDIVFGDEEHKTETNQLQIGIENTKATAVYENPSSHLDLGTALSMKFAISNTADGAEGVFGEEKPFIKCDEALAVDLTWVTGVVLDKEKAKEEEQETIVLDKVKDGPQTRAVHHTNTKIDVVCQKFDGYSCVAIDKETDGGDGNQDVEEKSNLDKDRDGPLKLEGEHENNDTGIVLEAVEKKISEEETAAIDDEGIDGAAEDSDDREERQQEEKLKIEKPGEEKTAKLWSCVPGYFCHKFRKRKQTKDSFVDKIISYY